jgi:hypothetical protein
MKVKAVFEFDYPQDEWDFKVYSKAHEMHQVFVDIEARIAEYFRHDDQPEAVIESIRSKVAKILKEME